MPFRPLRSQFFFLKKVLLSVGASVMEGIYFPNFGVFYLFIYIYIFGLGNTVLDILFVMLPAEDVGIYLLIEPINK